MKLLKGDKIVDNNKRESGFKLLSNELIHTGKVFQTMKKAGNIEPANLRKDVVMSLSPTKPSRCSFAIVIPSSGQLQYFLFLIIFFLS